MVAGNYVVKCSVLVIAGICIAACEPAYGLINLSAEYWQPRVSADAVLSTDAVSGTSVDLVDDLGLERSPRVPGFAASFDAPMLPEIRVSYQGFDASATKTITRSFVANGITYTGGDSVSSSYEFTEIEGTLGWKLLGTDTAQAGLVLGAKYIDIEMTLINNTASSSINERVRGALPVVGAHGELNLPGRFKVGAGLRGMTLKIAEFKGSFIDMDAAIHVELNKFLSVSGGYRYKVLDAEDTDSRDSLKVTFAGPFVGVSGKF